MNSKQKFEALMVAAVMIIVVIVALSIVYYGNETSENACVALGCTEKGPAIMVGIPDKVLVEAQLYNMTINVTGYIEEDGHFGADNLCEAFMGEGATGYAVYDHPDGRNDTVSCIRPNATFYETYELRVLEKTVDLSTFDFSQVQQWFEDLVEEK